MSIGQRLKESREEARLSQKALAAKSGVSQQMISKLECGRSFETTGVVALADALGVSPSWLQSNKGSKYVTSVSVGTAGAKAAATPITTTPDLDELISLATPRSKTALEKIAEASKRGKLSDEDLELLNVIAQRFTRE